MSPSTALKETVNLPPHSASQAQQTRRSSILNPTLDKRRDSACETPGETSSRRGSVDIFEGRPNMGRRASVSPLAPQLQAPTIANSDHELHGQKIVLECQITSAGKPEVTWFHLEEKIRDGGRYHVMLTHVGGQQWISYLEIHHVTREDAGKYTVHAKNEMGTNSATVFSFVEE